MSMTTSTCNCSCFLKHSPPPTTAKRVVLPRTSTECEASLARRCMVGMGCTAISLQLIGSIPAVENLSMGDPKWSEKRACPPWQMNSLEIIVPENLPRPSAKRGWEIVGQDSTMRIRVLLRNLNGCFSI